jgi:hypothetical protein
VGVSTRLIEKPGADPPSGSPRPTDPRNSYWLALAVLVFLSLAVASTLTKRPWVDEAWFASPALNLALNGHMGTYVLEPTGSHLSVLRPGTRLDRIDQHTYWIMPLHLLVLALFFKIFGFSVTVLRLPSLAWGLGALAAWYVIVRRLGGSRGLGALTVLLIGVDCAFVNGASDGRMDMMCASLGFISLAVYLEFRETRFRVAVILSHTAAALSVFTHPNGVLAAASLLLTFWYLDRKRFSWSLLPMAGSPYVLGALGWAAYIARDRAAFMAQFGANAGGRGAGFGSPLEAIRLELAKRYLEFHFLPADATLNGKLKLLILFAYVAALGLAIAMPALRRNPGYRLMLYLTGLRFFLMAWGVSWKLAYYLVHILPFYGFFLACVSCWLWQRSRAARWVAASVLCLFLALQLSWSLYRICVLQPYRKQYQPAMQFLKAEIAPQDLICGSAELGFAFGFDNPQIVDDLWVGRWSGKRPTILVIDKWYYYQIMHNFSTTTPLYYAYITGLLQNDFHEIYTQRDEYQVYRRNTAP